MGRGGGFGKTGMSMRQAGAIRYHGKQRGLDVTVNRSRQWGTTVTVNGTTVAVSDAYEFMNKEYMRLYGSRGSWRTEGGRS